MEHHPVWIPRVLVDAIHYAQLDEHGGSYGLRDANALEAALARPRQKLAYDPNVDLAALAGAYSFALARSHPYTDGNERVAFVAAEVFLELNGCDVDREDAEVVTAMIALAGSSLSEKSLARWFRDAMVPFHPLIVPSPRESPVESGKR
jgi:death on curing protein